MKNQFCTIAAVAFCLVLFAGTTRANAASMADDTNAPAAEAATLSGKIVDAVTQEPIAGVRVEGFGFERCTAMTGEDGLFTIKVPSTVTSLYISTPGYNSTIIAAREPQGGLVVKLYDEKFGSFVSKEFDITSKANATIDLTTATTMESEVEKQIGAEVRTITRSGTPAMGAIMMIQGINSINTSSQPLIILDGVMQDIQDSYSAVHDGFFNNILAGIDPNDIESIEVLKNGTSIYGAKGGNGVILINTRRGHSMATRIEANISGGFTMQPTLPTMMDASQYRIYANELMGGVTTSENARFPFLWDYDNYYYNMYHNQTDWTKYVYREAWSQNYKVNVQGGDEAAMYNFSLGYSDGDATVNCNDFNRLNIRFNTDIILADNLKTRFDIAYSRNNRNLRDDGINADLTSGPVSAPGFLSLIKSPFLSPYKYNSDGTLSPSLEAADTYANIDVNTRNNSLANPLTFFEHAEGNNKNVQEYTVFDVTVAPEWKIKPNFVIEGLFNYTLHRTNEKYFRPMTSSPNFYIAGLGYSQNEVRSFFSKESSVNADLHVDWNKRMGDHYLDVFGGVRYSNFAYDFTFQSCHNTGNDKLPDISSSYDFLDEDGDDPVWRNMAWYANADYNFRGKYFLQASLAAETSSRFGREIDGALHVGGVSWGLFPSFQAGWMASAEPWFNVPFIQMLKFNGGIDWTGNDNISSNAAFAYFSTVKYQDRAMGLVLSNIENQSIQWETTRRLNLGFDMVAFSDRIRLHGDLFANNTSNLLTLKNLNSITGLQSYWCNDGALQNRGFDLGVEARIVNQKDWKWSMGISAGHYNNKITSLPTTQTFANGKNGTLEGYTTSIYDATIITAIGQSAGVFYGFQTDGVYASDTDVPSQNGELLSTQNTATGVKEYFGAGDVKFIDQNGDNVINDADRVVIGNPNPTLFGNIHSELCYKNFTLSGTFNYNLGNSLYNYQRCLLESGSNFYNQTVAVCNRWKNEGDVTSMPKATYGDPLGNNRFSDRWIEDGSYLRLSELQLSYKVPVSYSWLQGLTVWGAANNLFTVTRYLGGDPEFSFSNNPLYQGIDCGLLPQSRSFHVGVKINL